MGYEYTPDALNKMANTLRTSAQHLAQSVSGAPPSPDAGDSSGLIAQVISTLLRSGAAIAAKQDSIADKIHASRGAYDDVENTNKGEFTYESRRIQHSNIK